MPVNWNLLSDAADPGRAFAAGIQQGQQFRRQTETENALASFSRNPSDPRAVNALMRYNPELALKVGEYQHDAAKRDALGRLFDPSPVAAQSNALAAALPTAGQTPPYAPTQQDAPPPLRMNEDGSPPTAPHQTPSAAPLALLDPSRLPKRTDGLTLNQEALRELYRLDPQSAMAIQKHVFDANEAQFKAMRQNGATLATAAWRLKQLPSEQRPAELEAMAPQLVQMGISPEQLAQADLSDQALDRYIVTGRSISNILDDDRADRRLDADVANTDADNARADRNTDSMISHRQAQEGIARRGQNIASSDRRRGQDVASTDRRRGQDMTDRRIRESAGFRGRGGSGGTVPTATNPQTGERMEYRGGKWVRAK